jgi:pentose-5-phosphate-3-epimerase
MAVPQFIVDMKLASPGARATLITVDAHLMISPCDPYLQAFAKAGCDSAIRNAAAWRVERRSSRPCFVKMPD